MLQRLSLLTAVLLVVFGLGTGTAAAQDDGADEETPAEIARYGDSELIEALRTYGLVDEWLATSPVSAEASLLLVSGNGGYQSQRQTFLNSIDAWASRTERVRSELARINEAQANTDRLRSAVVQVRDALVLDDRLASNSNTLREIESALSQIEGVQLPEHVPGQSEDPLTLAEIQLNDLWERAEAEVLALNGIEPAIGSSGVGAFVGFDELRVGLNGVDQLIERGRNLIRPARDQSEQLLSSTLAQIPDLHAARMLGSTDVGGLSVVTIDAYIRAAASASCSVDWALLAGIGQIESNHGRLDGATVYRSGQVSTTILGPLLDGGATERQAQQTPVDPEAVVAVVTEIVEALQAAQLSAEADFGSSLWSYLPGRSTELTDEEQTEELGNGFAVVVDTDGGRLDGNDQWDRAVGPMQFIPETWTKWATDGNGDGVADPHNLYDAAASAGRFLCNLSATRGSSASTFVLGYNSSTSYVRSVLSIAANLRSASLPNA